MVVLEVHIKSICCLRLLKLEDCTIQKHIVTADAAALADAVAAVAAVAVAVTAVSAV